MSFQRKEKRYGALAPLPNQENWGRWGKKEKTERTLAFFTAVGSHNWTEVWMLPKI